MSHSQPSEAGFSLLEMGSQDPLGGTHSLLLFQVHEASVFSLCVLSKALPILQDTPHLLFKGLWLLQNKSPLFHQLLFCPVQGSLRQSNRKGQAIGLQHRIGEQKKKKAKHTLMSKIDPATQTHQKALDDCEGPRVGVTQPEQGFGYLHVGTSCGKYLLW